MSHNYEVVSSYHLYEQAIPPQCLRVSSRYRGTIENDKRIRKRSKIFLSSKIIVSYFFRDCCDITCFCIQTIMDGFPVQFCFPLVPSVSATFRFDRMELQTPGCSVFAVPENYTLLVEDMFSPRTHQAMLQRVTTT